MEIKQAIPWKNKFQQFMEEAKIPAVEDILTQLSTHLTSASTRIREKIL